MLYNSLCLKHVLPKTKYTLIRGVSHVDNEELILNEKSNRAKVFETMRFLELSIKFLQHEIWRE